MKNAIQLVTVLDIKDSEIRELLEEQYEDDLSSSDNYLRYYPDDSSYDTKEGLTDKVNAWLISEGYYINTEDEFFHLLIRIDW
tara:strand:- start:396 stop:644 length:249 start_codon:yes stop_codon:yes gene_type:complete